MSNVKTETSRVALLSFLKQVEHHVKNAVDFKGEWKIERPSIYPSFQSPFLPVWLGTNHIKITFNLDLLSSQSIEKEEVNKDSMP